jgi:pimeloyl-ACP methyl ester carboxylesterase
MAPGGLFVDELGSDAGPGAPLVVLVHGSMDRHTSFARIRSRLFESCAVVSYDRRGYGASRELEPPATGLEDHLADLAEVVNGRRCTLVGHSYGGTLVLSFAARYPGLAASLLAYEPPLSWLAYWPTRGEHNRPFGDMTGPEAARSFLRRMVGERYHRLPAKTREEVEKDGDALIAELTAIRVEPPPFSPREIGCPALIARGEHAGAHHVRATAMLAEEIPLGELRIIEGAGHGGHQSHPREFSALVLEAVALAGAGD